MNMKNIFKLSAMILAAAFVAGCSQNDELDVTPVENEGQLTIHATASDFVSSDADTRIINEGADTQFEAGDKIGIFAIRSTDNKLLVQNMPLEYAGADWTGNDNKVYYYKNTAYVAYSPYDEKLNITDVTDIEDLQVKIKNYFTEKLEAAGNDQSVAYPSLDLMLASAEPSDGGDANTKSLSFNFKHQFALVEIEVPVKAYLDEAKNFTYAEPFTKDFTLDSKPLTMYPLSIKTEGEAGTGDAKAYSLFRFLVKPDTDYALAGELIYSTPIQLEAKKVKLEAGKYMKYKINATGAVGSYTQRAIAVGDYYYADGSIYPGPTAEQIVVNEGDMTVTFANTYQKPLVEGCLGVVFAVDDVLVTNSDNDRIWNKGYVFALEAPESIEWYPVTFTSEYNNYTATNAEGCTDFFDTLNGYELTHRNGTNGNSKALGAALEFGFVNADYAVSDIATSGWFMPSPGELLLLINNFCIGTDYGIPYEKIADEYKTIFDLKKAQKARKCAAEHLVRSIAAVDKNLSFSAEKSPTAHFWLTSAEYSSTEIWALEWKYQYENMDKSLNSNDQTLKFLKRNKSGDNNKTFITRPILAF